MSASVPSSGELRVALDQITTCPGQLQHNTDRHLEMATRAVAAGADLLIFPELSLSGYLPAHGVAERFDPWRVVLEHRRA